ncbi:MAG: hypothetical protein ABI946_03290 [Chthoniobacterales bacterium]
MPFRHLPNSRAQRLATMDQAAPKWLTSDAADRLIPAAHISAIDPSKPASLTASSEKTWGEPPPP